MSSTRTVSTGAGVSFLAGARRRLVREPLLAAFLLILPALALRLFTSLWPFLDTAWISLHRSGPMFGPDTWVGLFNYQVLLADPGVTGSIFYTAFYTIVSTVAEVGLGLAIAVLLNARFALRSVARTINLIPWAIPVVVTGIAFHFALDRHSGLLAALFTTVTGLKIDWLLDTWPARLAVVSANVWRNAPFVAIIVLAALQGIPEEIEEAARVDGAHGVVLFRTITLPLITPVLISVGIFFLIWQVATFDLVLAMTGGGPGEVTQVLGYEAYLYGFQGLDFGKSAAVSMMLFGFVAVLGLAGAALQRRAEDRL